jgi:hypothetical protein
MYRANWIVKLFLPALALLVAAAFPNAAAAEDAAAPQPHMMYVYNPSCRLCTATNEVIARVEEQHKNAMTFQRFDIADQKTGADDVMYMFDLMDELQLPETDGTTLIVFLGLLETIDGEVYFTPKRALVDGENIIEKLEGEIADFLLSNFIPNEDKLTHSGKGGSLGHGQAPFFFQHSAQLCARSSRLS